MNNENVVIVGAGTAGKHYINILKSKKNINIFVIDTKFNTKSKNYTLIKFDEIKKKNLKFKYAIISTPSGLHYKHALFF